jgi:hypothetical protein
MPRAFHHCVIEITQLHVPDGPAPPHEQDPPGRYSMSCKQHFMLLCLAVILSSIIGCTGVSKVSVKKVSQNYEVYDPGKKLIFVIPQDGFTMRDLRDENLRAYESSPSFFYLENKISNLDLSIWFASENIYPGIKKFWDNEVEGWKRVGLPSPQHVSFSKIGIWEATIYEMEYPGYTKSYIKAHLVKEGVWTEIILSIRSGSPRDSARLKLEDTLKTIQVKENR